MEMGYTIYLDFLPLMLMLELTPRVKAVDANELGMWKVNGLLLSIEEYTSFVIGPVNLTIAPTPLLSSLDATFSTSKCGFEFC